MKVSVEITPGCQSPYAVIYTQSITEEIQRLLGIFSAGETPVMAQKCEKLVVLQPDDIYMVRTENNSLVIYGREETFYSRKRLYEIKEQLGSRFMQISKSAVVNLSYLESVETGFSGTLLLRLKNGCKEYVSRTYLPGFKKYLGL